MDGRRQSSASRAWTRWQDWATLVLGAATLCSPLFVPLTSTGDPQAVLTVLGLLLVVTSLGTLGAPESVSFEWLHGVLGALLLFSPWYVGYTDNTAAAWLAWVCGSLTVLVAATALPAARVAHRADLARRATVRALARRRGGWMF